MRRLRILQIFNRYFQPGGEESSVYRIGDALQQDHDVEYLLGSTKELFELDSFSRATAPFQAWHSLRTSRRLRRYQEVGKFDLWLIHNVLPGLSPSVYQNAFQIGVPVIHYLHNYRMGCINGFFLNHGKPCERCLGGNFFPALQTACWHDSRLISGMAALVTLRIRQLKTFNKVAAWIALSNAQREKHVQIGLPREKLEVIPHFYEAKGEAPFSCPDGDVLFLGRLSPEKGVDHLLYAWKHLPKNGRRLKIAGDGPEMPKLRALARDLGLTNVDFLGYLDKSRQAEIWARTAFSVIPSVWSEPFPLTFLESWANGRTFVANRLGAMAEVVQEGKDGFLADPFSHESLAGQIQKLLTSPAQIHSMGEAGRARIQSEFTRGIWMKRINSLIQKVLSQSPLKLT